MKLRQGDSSPPGASVDQWKSSADCRFHSSKQQYISQAKEKFSSQDTQLQALVIGLACSTTKETD